MWKLTNIFLICASFLCNATEYEPIFLLADHFAIVVVCTSYLNTCINIPFSLLLLYEYNKYKCIEKSKLLSLVLASCKSIIYTYLYSNDHLYAFLIALMFAVVVYNIRYRLLEMKEDKYILFLTCIFHSCITTMLYISSITAFAL